MCSHMLFKLFNDAYNVCIGKDVFPFRVGVLGVGGFIAVTSLFRFGFVSLANRLTHS